MGTPGAAVKGGAPIGALVECRDQSGGQAMFDRIGRAAALDSTKDRAQFGSGGIEREQFG